MATPVSTENWLDAGGSIGIGSDSNISVSPIEELRWLEYAQRLLTRHRNISSSEAEPSTGTVLHASALHGGAAASGMPIGCFMGGDPELPSVGNRADLLVLDEASPLLAGRDATNLIDTWILPATQSRERVWSTVTGLRDSSIATSAIAAVIVRSLPFTLLIGG